MAKTRICPMCRAAVPWEGNPWRPFCSDRCRLLDLHAWLGEHYAVPVDEGQGESARSMSDITESGSSREQEAL